MRVEMRDAASGGSITFGELPNEAAYGLQRGDAFVVPFIPGRWQVIAKHWWFVPPPAISLILYVHRL